MDGWNSVYHRVDQNLFKIIILTIYIYYTNNIFSFQRSAGHQGHLTWVTLRDHIHIHTIRPHWLHFKVRVSLRRAVSAFESSVVWWGALEQWLVGKQKQPRIKSGRETGSRAASHILSITSDQRWHKILRPLSTSLKISTSNFPHSGKKEKRI